MRFSMARAMTTRAIAPLIPRIPSSELSNDRPVPAPTTAVASEAPKAPLPIKEQNQGESISAFDEAPSKTNNPFSNVPEVD